MSFPKTFLRGSEKKVKCQVNVNEYTLSLLLLLVEKNCANKPNFKKKTATMFDQIVFAQTLEGGGETIVPECSCCEDVVKEEYVKSFKVTFRCAFLSFTLPEHFLL